MKLFFSPIFNSQMKLFFPNHQHQQHTKDVFEISFFFGWHSVQFIYSLRTNLDVSFAWARLLKMVWGLLKRVSSKG